MDVPAKISSHVFGQTAGRVVTQAPRRWEMDSTTLALSKGKLDLLTSVTGDKANEPSERDLVGWHDEVMTPGRSARQAVRRADSGGDFCGGAVM